MQLLKCDILQEGPGPSERIIMIDTQEGKEEIVVHSSILVGKNKFEVGLIGKSNGHALIELPRESSSGRWRVWVPSSALTEA
jgi:hypothetical protein